MASGTPLASMTATTLWEAPDNVSMRRSRSRSAAGARLRIETTVPLTVEETLERSDARAR